jgi:dephospho-CoA kinase
MLRVGLTGGLGSGKSTVAQMFAAHGVHVISADEVGRRLMQPGEVVYQRIVEHFGPEVVQADSTLNRRLLADLAFRQGRLDELNRIVHPPVIAAQEAWMEEIFARDAQAMVMIESALIFEAGETGEAGKIAGTVPGWRDRFDRIVLVTAPDEIKVQRFLERIGAGDGIDPVRRSLLEQDARSRLAAQIPDSEKIPLSSYVIDNSGSLAETQRQVDAVFAELLAANR